MPTRFKFRETLGLRPAKQPGLSRAGTSHSRPPSSTSPQSLPKQDATQSGSHLHISGAKSSPSTSSQNIIVTGSPSAIYQYTSSPPSSSNPKPVGIHANQGTVGESRHYALDKAIQKHLERLPEKERDLFRQASKSIDAENILTKVKQYDHFHRNTSRFRPKADNITHFLSLLNRFMAGVAIGIQASPDISSLVVGGVRVIIDVMVRFVEYFGRFTEMLCRFGDWLRPLEEYCQESPSDDLIVDAAAKIYGDLLMFCRKAYIIFIDDDGIPRRRTTVRAFFRVQWTSFEDDFGVIEKDMHHHLEVLLYSAMASQSKAIKGLKTLQHHTSGKAEVETRRKFLEWISPGDKVDFEKSHDTIHAKKHPGTNDWLVRTNEFRKWYDSTSPGLLWCYGKPGAGKSVLASNVLEYVTSHHLFGDEVGISFAYYNYKDEHLNDPAIVIAALVKQLCQRKDTIPPFLLQSFNNNLGPSAAGSSESYIKLASQFKHVFLVIDALDECPKSERRYILDFIAQTAKACAKVFLTSWHELDIKDALEAMNTPMIGIKTDDVSPDIERFVNDRVKELRNKELHVKSNALERKIVESLTAKAEGMFLWVNLQLENLCEVSKSKRDQRVDAELDRLPQGLNSTYDRVLKRIEGQLDFKKNLALKCFMWVLYAKRPLCPIELQHAVAITFCSEFEDLQADLDDIDFMLESCGNLLLIERGVIKPIHYSVQEFFSGLLSRTHSQVLGRSFSVASLHAELSKGCMNYLTLGLRSLKPCNTSHELFRRIRILSLGIYASHSFDHHIKSSYQTNPDIVCLTNNFLDSDSEILGAVLQMRAVGGEYWGSLDVDFQNMAFDITGTTVVYASQLHGVESFRSRYIDSRVAPYVIHQAAIAGSREVVQELLDRGEDVDGEDTQGVTPLYYAASYGHGEIVELLFERGADANVVGGQHGSPLIAAASGGRATIVEMLINNGADISAVATRRADKAGEPNDGTEDYGNALHASASAGQEKIVRILLDKGADVHAQSGRYGNALQAASCSGFAENVQILLDKGADINAQGGRYGNALQAALVTTMGPESDAVIQILLDNGADINAQGGQFGNALQTASMSGNSSVVQMLLDKGADINAQGGIYGNALQAASTVSVAQILLDHGAEVNKQGGTFGNALQSALQTTTRQWSSC